MENKQQENKMGTMPIGKLLATMAIPMILSMLVQALYNVVDSVYVSRIGEDASDRGISGVSHPKPDHCSCLRLGGRRQFSTLAQSGQQGL